MALDKSILDLAEQARMFNPAYAKRWIYVPKLDIVQYGSPEELTHFAMLYNLGMGVPERNETEWYGGWITKDGNVYIDWYPQKWQNMIAPRTISDLEVEKKVKEFAPKFAMHFDDDDDNDGSYHVWSGISYFYLPKYNDLAITDWEDSGNHATLLYNGGDELLKRIKTEGGLPGRIFTRGPSSDHHYEIENYETDYAPGAPNRKYNPVKDQAATARVTEWILEHDPLAQITNIKQTKTADDAGVIDTTVDTTPSSTGLEFIPDHHLIKLVQFSYPWQDSHHKVKRHIHHHLKHELHKRLHKVAVEWDNGDLDPREIDNRDGGMEVWQALEQQVIQLAQRYDVAIHWLRRDELEKSYFDGNYDAREGWEDGKIKFWLQADFPHITGERSYFTALHEIGHCAFRRIYQQPLTDNSLEEESWAWHFALENAQMAFSDDTLQWAHSMWQTYDTPNTYYESPAYPGWYNNYDHKQMNDERARGLTTPMNPNYPAYSNTSSLRFEIDEDGETENGDDAIVCRAYLGDECVGILRVYADTGLIAHIEVAAPHRRQGIATAMYNEMQSAGYNVKHDWDSMSEEGLDWAKHVGAPEDWSPIKIDQLSEPYKFEMPLEIEQRFVDAMECPQCHHNLRNIDGQVYCEYCGWQPRTSSSEFTLTMTDLGSGYESYSLDQTSDDFHIGELDLHRDDEHMTVYVDWVYILPSFSKTNAFLTLVRPVQDYKQQGYGISADFRNDRLRDIFYKWLHGTNYNDYWDQKTTSLDSCPRCVEDIYHDDDDNPYCANCGWTPVGQTIPNEFDSEEYLHERYLPQINNDPNLPNYLSTDFASRGRISPEWWSILRDQVEQIASLFNATVAYAPDRDYFHGTVWHIQPPNESGQYDLTTYNPHIVLPTIDNVVSYAVALHELGHIDFRYQHHKTPGDVQQAPSQEEELYAWHYMLEHSKIPLSESVLKEVEELFSSYNFAPKESPSNPNWIQSNWKEDVYKFAYNPENDTLKIGDYDYDTHSGLAYDVGVNDRYDDWVAGYCDGAGNVRFNSGAYQPKDDTQRSRIIELIHEQLNIDDRWSAWVKQAELSSGSYRWAYRIPSDKLVIEKTPRSIPSHAALFYHLNLSEGYTPITPAGWVTVHGIETRPDYVGEPNAPLYAVEQTWGRDNNVIGLVRQKVMDGDYELV